MVLRCLNFPSAILVIVIVTFSLWKVDMDIIFYDLSFAITQLLTCYLRSSTIVRFARRGIDGTGIKYNSSIVGMIQGPN